MFALATYDKSGIFARAENRRIISQKRKSEKIFSSQFNDFGVFPHFSNPFEFRNTVFRNMYVLNVRDLTENTLREILKVDNFLPLKFFVRFGIQISNFEFH